MNWIRNNLPEDTHDQFSAIHIAFRELSSVFRNLVMVMELSEEMGDICTVIKDDRALNEKVNSNKVF